VLVAILIISKIVAVALAEHFQKRPGWIIMGISEPEAKKSPRRDDG
jgi:hypothetical protein